MKAKKAYVTKATIAASLPFDIGTALYKWAHAHAITVADIVRRGVFLALSEMDEHELASMVADAPMRPFKRYSW